MNGGFGLVLDGSEDAAKKARSMLNWDVSNGVARRYAKRHLKSNDLVTSVFFNLCSVETRFSANSLLGSLYILYIVLF